MDITLPNAVKQYICFYMLCSWIIFAVLFDGLIVISLLRPIASPLESAVVP